jgi:hypothetical protein
MMAIRRQFVCPPEMTSILYGVCSGLLNFVVSHLSAFHLAEFA